MVLFLFLLLVFFLFLLFFLLFFCCMSISFRMLVIFFSFFVLLFLFLLFFFNWCVRRWIWFSSTSFTLAWDIFWRLMICFRVWNYFCNDIVSDRCDRLALNTIICIALFPVWRSAFIWFTVLIQLEEKNYTYSVSFCKFI